MDEKGEPNRQLVEEGKHSKKIWKKWWFWALVVAVLIGGVMEYTEPETEEPATATMEQTTEPTEVKEAEPGAEKSEVTEEPETEKNEQAEEPTTKTEPQEHIYDNAIIKDVMNGFRSEKIGEYSIIEIKSDQVTEEILADWYFNYVEKNDFNWNIILYTDRKNEGIYAITGIINKDVKFNIDEYGDYSLGDSANGITYVPDSENTLKEMQ